MIGAQSLTTSRIHKVAYIVTKLVNYSTPSVKGNIRITNQTHPWMASTLAGKSNMPAC